LLGPNGAGKSLLMRISATVTRPASGRLLFDGTEAVARPGVPRRNLGYLPQDFGVYLHLSAREFLSYLAVVKGLPARAVRRRTGELLELLDLAGVGKRPLGTYSGGMLRRVGIVQALLADPRVLIADEPTAGLDPEQWVVFRNLLADLAGDRVVLLSTHIVSDIESVAADIAIMAGGRLLRRGSPRTWPPSTPAAPCSASGSPRSLTRCTPSPGPAWRCPPGSSPGGWCCLRPSAAWRSSSQPGSAASTRPQPPAGRAHRRRHCWSAS
jgi:ABC-type multidrug transport system ATPase subunit